MSITPKYHEMKAGNWRKTGFMSRFLTVRFKYSPDTVHLIHKAIRDGHVIPEPVQEKIPEFATLIEVKKEHANLLAMRAEMLGKENRTYGFRYQRALRCLCKASAMLNGRNTVNDSDVESVISWSEFFTDKEIIL